MIFVWITRASARFCVKLHFVNPSWLAPYSLAKEINNKDERNQDSCEECASVLPNTDRRSRSSFVYKSCKQLMERPLPYHDMDLLGFFLFLNR